MGTALSETRLQRAEHYFSAYAVVLPDGVTLADALKPEFWVHVTKRLRQHDTIRILPEDSSFFAEALVLSAGTGFAKLKLLRHINLEDEIEPANDTSAAYAKWRGPHSKWSVIRRGDGQVLQEGFAARIDAERQAAAYSSIAA